MKKRQVSYRWRLREVMAEHGMFATTELVSLLSTRRVCLSPSQVHRLVTGTPERLSLPVLAALCDIFATDPGELITTAVANVGLRRKAKASGESLSPATLAALRPKRDLISDPDQ